MTMNWVQVHESPSGEVSTVNADRILEMHACTIAVGTDEVATGTRLSFGAGEYLDVTESVNDILGQITMTTAVRIEGLVETYSS